MTANGLIPRETLTLTSTGHRLRADAARSFDRMAKAFRRDLGYALAITDAYRDLPTQIRLKALKGPLAAKPGTSVHGLALALDLGSGVPNESSAAHRWMDANASAYGWVNPLWARNYDARDGAHEPWHWEYVPALDQHAGGTLAARPIEEVEMTPEQANQLANLYAAIFSGGISMPGGVSISQRIEDHFAAINARLTALENKR